MTNVDTNDKLYYCAKCKLYMLEQGTILVHNCDCQNCEVPEERLHYNFYNDYTHPVREVNVMDIIAKLATNARRKQGEGASLT